MLTMAKKLLITKRDVKPSREDFEVIGVFNPGCIQFNDRTLLLLRVAERPVQKVEGCVSIPLLDEKTNDIYIKNIRKDDKDFDFSDPRIIYGKERSYLTSMSHLRLAQSTDGEHFVIDDKPTIMPSCKYEEYGIEDPRITCIDGVYNICYACSSEYGILNGLVQTTDFVHFEKKGYMFHPDNKDVAIFPQKIGGKYYALHRPSTSEFGKRNIWLAESSDLISWGNHRVIACPRGGFFDGGRVGAGCVPFLTDAGWLELYHGASDDDQYAIGALLLDRDDPSKVIARTDKPLVFPKETFEREGFFGNVVFSCGCIVEGNNVEMYYGAADEYVAKTELKVSDIMAAFH